MEDRLETLITTAQALLEHLRRDPPEHHAHPFSLSEEQWKKVVAWCKEENFNVDLSD